MGWVDLGSRLSRYTSGLKAAQIDTGIVSLMTGAQNWSRTVLAGRFRSHRTIAAPRQMRNARPPISRAGFALNLGCDSSAAGVSTSGATAGDAAAGTSVHRNSGTYVPPGSSIRTGLWAP